jgi:hypothetical protein
MADGEMVWWIAKWHGRSGSSSRWWGLKKIEKTREEEEKADLYL